jgi:hypothetical protein
VRTGNLSSLTERDWASVRERRAFEQAEREKQRLAEDQIEYEKYVQIVHDDQQRVAPAHRIAPIPLEEWRAFTDSSIGDPVLRGARATNEALLSKVRRDEAAEVEAERKQARESVLAGKPDPSWKIPASAAGLKMTIEQAREFAKTAAAQFVKENPEYHATMNNFETIVAYLTTNGVVIPTSEVFKLAWLRLRELSLIEELERLVPAKEPETVTQPSEPLPAEGELVDGYDLETGEPRRYSQAEIWKMSSGDLKKAFRMWTDREGDRRPRFTRGYFGR